MHLCLILILLGTFGCEPPGAKSVVPKDPPDTNTEVLGVAGPIDRLESWAFSFDRLTLGQSVNGFQVDFKTNQIHYNINCDGSPEEATEPLPSEISSVIQQLFSTEEICQLNYEIPPDTPVCMAMMLPLATVDLASGESLALNRAGGSICYQSINYFCKKEAEEEFIQRLEDLQSLAPQVCPPQGLPTR